MSCQSKVSTSATSGKDVVLIYYPQDVDDISQVHDTINRLQQTLNLGNPQGHYLQELDASHNNTHGILLRDISSENLERHTTNQINLADSTSLITDEQQIVTGKDSTDSFVPHSLQNIDPINHFEAELDVAKNDSLFEDFLNDAELDSFLNGLDTIDEPTKKGSDKALPIRDENMSIFNFTNNRNNNDQMHADDAAPNMVLTTSDGEATPFAAGSLPITNINNRFQCTHPNCGADFNRAGDLRRHQRTHGAPTYPCTVNGCVRQGMNAFHRRDKLLDHRRKKHGIAV